MTQDPDMRSRERVAIQTFSMMTAALVLLLVLVPWSPATPIMFTIFLTVASTLVLRRVLTRGPFGRSAWIWLVLAVNVAVSATLAYLGATALTQALI